MVTPIGDFSRFTMARAIQNKSDAAGNLRDLIARFEAINKSVWNITDIQVYSAVLQPKHVVGAGDLHSGSQPRGIASS